METLIKSTTNAMKKMMSLIKTTIKLPTTNQATGKLPTTNRTIRKRRRGKKGAKNTTMHQFANIVERNIPPNQKTSVGN
jgi:hypothetical protein